MTTPTILPHQGEVTDLRMLALIAEEAINAYRAGIQTHNECVDALVVLARQRPAHKLAALGRLLEQEHPATPGKRYTFTAAQDVLQIDDIYSAFKIRCDEAEAAVREAEAELRTLWLEADLRVAQFKAQAGVR